ncbi:MAG: hypothetical protein RIE86_27540 [Imperialibacter sp.]|uniref:hypothetical protein n=1 Tax=Imperialibacter sp. TaxID=2038411 RepID=UPI0032ECD0E3
MRKFMMSGHEDRLNNRACVEESNASDILIQGVIIEKYLIARKLRKFKYLDGKDTIDSELLLFETSKVYDFVHVGDTLSKSVGSLALKLKRANLDTVLVLDYSCDHEAIKENIK